ncbi:MAG: InlB B-repeat-containing protein [Clostridia bacterium]|nr:InlB B-repeat-containing protein [Clostridia bacterium]
MVKNLKIKMTLSFVFIIVLFMFLGVFNVHAESVKITLSQADFNEAKANPDVATAKGVWYHVNGSEYLYILGRNTDYIIDGEINLDDGAGEIELTNNNIILNNATITGGIKTESSTNNTLNGSGTVSGYVRQYGGSLTVNGTIVFNKLFTSENANTTIINGGTFCDGFMARRNTDVTINNATINTGASMSNAIQVDDYSTIVINNATVTANNVALASDEAGNVTIKGGTFTGGTAGLFVTNGTCKVSGGTFKTTGTSNIWGKNGAIAIRNTMSFDDLLADGYKYSAATDYSDTTQGTNVNFRFLNAREISVATQYAVMFNTDGGSAVANQTVTGGEKVTRPTLDPTKDGYAFDDWYADDTYSTKFDFANTTITTDTIIYAKFIQKTTNNNENNNTNENNTTTDNNENTNSTSTIDTTNNNTNNSNDTNNTEKATEKNSNNPKTGDNIAIWIGLMLVSMLGVAETIKFIKKRK